jgi:adenine deaminase
MQDFSISGQYIDLFRRRIYPATITVRDGNILQIDETESAPPQYLMPGFVDAHVHVESSMLLPTAFARLAVIHGTVATVSDPHEIANVCGEEGVSFMIANARQTPFHFFFGAPSCVPATAFETAGAKLAPAEVRALLAMPEILYLSEMMNYPGVLQRDPEVMEKIAAARAAGKPIDGHAPGLRGAEAAAYAAAGITTDHECFTLEEALDKIKAGMHILIREGSAARNFEALAPLLGMHPAKVMFCSDDKHPDELVQHHIDDHVRRALQKGYDLFDVLRAACVNPVLHYGLPVGLLREGDPADFIIVENLEKMQVRQTFINGHVVARDGRCLLPEAPASAINRFEALPKVPENFRISTTQDNPQIRVIEALDGQLVTRELILPGKTENGFLVCDPERDILKIAVVSRYEPDAQPALAFVKNFGLKQGALASTVAHDCHNIIAVGTDDQLICTAVNELIRTKGGITAVSGDGQLTTLPLPVAGLMSTDDGHQVAAAYAATDRAAKALGCTLRAPFMTLSFMALLVIPELKLSDKGLFNGRSFSFTPLEA